MGLGLGSPFGHAALRYTLPGGESVVMNIVKNDERGYMVNFVPAHEYLYGTSMFDHGAEQGGVYNRRVIGVRIERWDDDCLRDLVRCAASAGRRCSSLCSF